MKMAINIITLVLFVFGTTVLPSVAQAVDYHGDCQDSGCLKSFSANLSSSAASGTTDDNSPVQDMSQHNCNLCCHHTHIMIFSFAASTDADLCAGLLLYKHDTPPAFVTYSIDRPPRVFA